MDFHTFMIILHSAMSRELSSGITRQMLSEQESAREVGLSWHVGIYVPYQKKQKLLKTAVDADLEPLLVADSAVKNTWVQFRQGFYCWLLQQEADYDAVVLRHSCYDPFQLLYVLRSTRPVYLVHHTLEVPELKLANQGLNRLKAPFEAFLGRLSQKYASGVIGVTQEIVDYECERANMSRDKGFVYPNGISADEVVAVEDRRCETPRLIFVASHFYPWHGLDLLLESVAASDADFLIDLVGVVDPNDKEIADKDPRVKLHGYLSIAKIRELAAYADLGLSSLALSRNGMKDACPLKTREYLAMGLPVYAGYNDVFPESFPYFTKGGCDISEALACARKLQGVKRETVAETSVSYIDKAVLLKSLYDWLLNNEEAKKATINKD